jgi:hypothetical protein
MENRSLTVSTIPLAVIIDRIVNLRWKSSVAFLRKPNRFLANTGYTSGMVKDLLSSVLDGARKYFYNFHYEFYLSKLIFYTCIASVLT